MWLHIFTTSVHTLLWFLLASYCHRHRKENETPIVEIFHVKAIKRGENLRCAHVWGLADTLNQLLKWSLILPDMSAGICRDQMVTVSQPNFGAYTHPHTHSNTCLPVTKGFLYWPWHQPCFLRMGRKLQMTLIEIFFSPLLSITPASLSSSFCPINWTAKRGEKNHFGQPWPSNYPGSLQTSRIWDFMLAGAQFCWLELEERKTSRIWSSA